MEPISVIAIFDIGKTNKKLLLFDEQYRLVWESVKQLDETNDEEGYACEDLSALILWMQDALETLMLQKEWIIKAINFSAYGASLVYLNADGNTILPLYNYLKPYPAGLQEKFYLQFGGEQKISKETASPILGNLNSGMQLYRIKNQYPAQYLEIDTALHLPQYLSYILTRNRWSDYTSIGCHTQLWDFTKNKYHNWVLEEGMETKLAPIKTCDELGGQYHQQIPVGVGIHDSSAALIPYLMSFTEPFLLISTGTWCISLNPFNETELTDEELKQDCLCFISYKGKPVKASRLFAGHEHELAIKKLADQFNKPLDYYTTVGFNAELLKAKNDEDYETAYHRLMYAIVQQQITSTSLVLQGATVRKFFVDGGFSRNPIYMQLLANHFKGIEIYAASIPQASAMGAALAIHQHWNTKNIPTDIIALKYYATKISI